MVVVDVKNWTRRYFNKRAERLAVSQNGNTVFKLSTSLLRTRNIHVGRSFYSNFHLTTLLDTVTLNAEILTRVSNPFAFGQD